MTTIIESRNKENNQHLYAETRGDELPAFTVRRHTKIDTIKSTGHSRMAQAVAWLGNPHL